MVEPPFDPIEDPQVRRAWELLPAWFIPRMMTDHWEFGLLTTTGDIIAISTILAVNASPNGEVWLDVELSEHRGIPQHNIDLSKLITSPTERTSASIAAKHIVAAFELAYT